VSDVRARPPSLAEIKRDALDLARQLNTSGKTRDFLIKQLTAIAARANLAQGTRLGFDEEARALFDVTLPPSDPSGPSKLRLEIGRLLPGPGTLARRYADFEQKFLIPPERLPAVMNRALKSCRERTLENLKLPPNEAVTLEYVSDKPWNAYSSYKGGYQSRIRVNPDFDITVDRALQLACHEGYPGHHAFNLLVDEQLVQRERRFDLLAQPTFSPQSFLSEALASYAVEVAFPDRFSFERDVLFPLAGIAAKIGPKDADLYARVNQLADRLQIAQIDIARRYIDGRLEWARAASALEEEALMAHTEATLKYLNQYGTYMLTYTVGKEMVSDCFSKRSTEDRWALFQELILGRVDLNACASGR
jgi:hypothetical protein